MGFNPKCIPATYFFGYNVVYTAIGLFLIGLSIYLMVGENTALNRAILACSIIYTIISMWGLGFRRGLSGIRPSNLYLVFLALLTLFQIAIFCAYTIFQPQALKQTSELDNGT